MPRRSTADMRAAAMERLGVPREEAAAMLADVRGDLSPFIEAPREARAAALARLMEICAGSARALADSLGVSPDTVSRWMQGAATCPDALLMIVLGLARLPVRLGGSPLTYSEAVRALNSGAEEAASALGASARDAEQEARARDVADINEALSRLDGPALALLASAAREFNARLAENSEKYFSSDS